jgi:hypothetical protein
VEETWADYPDEGSHRHSQFELALGRVLYRDARPDTDADSRIYMRARSGPVLMALLGLPIVAGFAVFHYLTEGYVREDPWPTLIALSAWALYVTNYWWFEWVRIDGRTVERSQLFGLIRRGGRLEALREVQSRPLRGLRGVRTPSMRFVFSDHTFEVRAAAHHWVDGRKLMMRLHERGVPIAPKLVRHFELEEDQAIAGANT